MMFANATNINRKFGGAKPRDLQFCGPFLEMFFSSVVCHLKFTREPQSEPRPNRSRSFETQPSQQQKPGAGCSDR